MLTRNLPKSCFPTNNTRGLPHVLVRWGHITVGEAAVVVGGAMQNERVVYSSQHSIWFLYSIKILYNISL